MEEINKNLELYEKIQNTPKEEFEDLFEHIHPSDILELLEDEELEIDKTLFLNELPEWFLASLLNEAEAEDKYDLLNLINPEKHTDVLEEMASDELVDMIETLDEKEQEEVLQNLNPEDQIEVEQLLTYEPTSAGGIMQTEFINIYDNKTVRKVLAYLREIKDEVENAYSLFVVDRQNHVKGSLSLESLVTADLEDNVLDIMNPNIISVNYKTDQEEVILEFEKYNLAVIPVVDDDERMIGVITFDDIMEIMQEEATADMLQMAGVHAEETVDSTIADTIKSRLPWLIINLATAFLASSVIRVFSDSISKVVVLASIMPIIAGMGGNAGTQTLTLVTRSIALGELDKKNLYHTLLKEIGAGIFNGIVIGVITGTISFLMSGNYTLGLIVGIAMIMNTLVAVTAGFSVPYVLDHLNIDPAVSSSVFVTTFTDVFGFLFLLGLASMFIERLM